MSIRDILDRMRSQFDGFGSPASPQQLSQLSDAVGPLHPDVIALYSDHNGSVERPKRGSHFLPARLMPVNEVLETCKLIDQRIAPTGHLGSVAWLWYDEQSNYAGIYKTGPLTGWITVLNHEEPAALPAFRSCRSFLAQMLDHTPSFGAITDVPRELPRTSDEPAVLAEESVLGHAYRAHYANETDDNLKLVYALTSMALTPVAESDSLAEHFDNADMWISEAAVKLLTFRRIKGHVAALELLAHNGKGNARSAAMRCLALMKTRESEAAIHRLSTALTGQAKNTLEMWTRPYRPLPAPQWP